MFTQLICTCPFEQGERMLTEDVFIVLNTLRIHQCSSQRAIAEKTDLSLGKVNQVIKDLISENRITEKYQLTSAGLQSLKPYQVNNAIIMAAGMSTRFAPLSYEKPKALLKVKGELLIEREIQQLHDAGIKDVTVVVGYMKEKLFYLEDKYHVKIVVNDDYYRYNNPSTLMPVLGQLSNTYICSSDNYFVTNPFEAYVYHAYYAAVYAEGKTDEYCIQAENSGRIKAVTIGGENAWYMLGHVYFDTAFSKKFAQILKAEYDAPNVKEHLWEDLYIKHIKELDMNIRKYDSSLIKEFDSLDELRDFDEKYIDNTDSKIFQNICYVLKCQEKDIKNIHPIKTGLTNLSFFFSCMGKNYVYRHPGVGTDTYINRESEASSMTIAKELGLDDTFIYIEPKQGWKISHFVENAKTLDYHNDGQVRQAMKMLRTLHTSGKTTNHDFNIWHEINNFEKTLKEKKRTDFEDADKLQNLIQDLHASVDQDHVKKCLCHCDSYDPNFLIDQEGKMYLIDWEYSGMSDPAGDIGTFLSCSDYDLKEAKQLIAIYLDHEPSEKELRHYMAYAAILSYYWFIWALYQDSVGKTVGEWTYLWYQHTKMYGAEARKLYLK